MLGSCQSGGPALGQCFVFAGMLYICIEDWLSGPSEQEMPTMLVWSSEAGPKINQQ